MNHALAKIECSCKVKPKSNLMFNKQSRLRGAKKPCNWSVDDCSKVKFSDESRMCIGAGDDRGKFVWRFQNENEMENCS